MWPNSGAPMQASRSNARTLTNTSNTVLTKSKVVSARVNSKKDSLHNRLEAESDNLTLTRHYIVLSVWFLVVFVHFTK